MPTIKDTLVRLNQSSFRASFHLDKHDLAYIDDKGLETIKSHCKDLIHKRLAPAIIPNDGRQTPMRGHPVFKAQHACGCCCRGCLEKWYRVKPGVDLTASQEERIVNLLMAWITKEYNEKKRP